MRLGLAVSFVTAHVDWIKQLEKSSVVSVTSSHKKCLPRFMQLKEVVSMTVDSLLDEDDADLMVLLCERWQAA